ncbi:MAG: hypothetical protein MJB14_20860 [Spirochaetes bacterium]|nr:hypothetical protein [Spirochaetota bacterium]
MRQKYYLFPLAICLLLLISNCQQNHRQKIESDGSVLSQNDQLQKEIDRCFGWRPSITGKGVPEDGKILLHIGQDLLSCSEYNATSNGFAEPAGIVTYVNLYTTLDNGAGGNPYWFGGLGEDPSGVLSIDVDWGAGPLNAHKAGYDYPNSTLSIGLWMVEDIWARDGLDKIITGDYDNEIIRLANFIKSFGENTAQNGVLAPVYLRIGYEFEPAWNYYEPDQYKAAFQRIVDIIRPIAPNMITVWQAATSPEDQIYQWEDDHDIHKWHPWHPDQTTIFHEEVLRNNQYYTLQDYYPGDSYVDWCGISWFLSNQVVSDKWDALGINPVTQKEAADVMLQFAREHQKPVMICESTPKGYDLLKGTFSNITSAFNTSLASGEKISEKTPQEIWREWYLPLFLYIYRNLDVIRCLHYINANWDAQPKWGPPYHEGYWGDSRVQVNQYIKNKWQREINRWIWKKGSPSLFSELEE